MLVLAVDYRPIVYDPVVLLHANFETAGKFQSQSDYANELGRILYTKVTLRRTNVLLQVHIYRHTTRCFKGCLQHITPTFYIFVLTPFSFFAVSLYANFETVDNFHSQSV